MTAPRAPLGPEEMDEAIQVFREAANTWRGSVPSRAARYDLAADAIAQLVAERAALREALAGVDKYALVIESAVRYGDPSHRMNVTAVLLKVRSSLRSQAQGGENRDLAEVAGRTQSAETVQSAAVTTPTPITPGAE